jgi:Uma2 family endonuclease
LRLEFFLFGGDVMQGALKNPYVSEADYLAEEMLRQDKNEYVSGQVFAITGASKPHNKIALNVAIALNSAASSQCRVSMSDIKFKADQLYYYPDVMVACKADSNDYSETQPCLIVEVLSPSTESVDRGEKLHNYQKVPELEAYLLVSQKERRVDVYKRSGSVWQFESVTSGEIELSCPRMTLSLEEIYKNVILDAEIKRASSSFKTPE